MNIEFDMYQTLALAVLVLLLGSFLKKHIHFLEKFCIPAPVIGGLLFAILTCIGYSTGLADFTFDDTLREVCMVFFFTSVGFQANLKVLTGKKKGSFIKVSIDNCTSLMYDWNIKYRVLYDRAILNKEDITDMFSDDVARRYRHAIRRKYDKIIQLRLGTERIQF